MSDNINSIFFNDKDFIAVFVKGVVNPSVALEVISHAKEEMKKHNCRNVFFDVSDTLSSATTSDNFSLAQGLSSILPEGEYRWSVFYKSDPYMYKMIAEIAQNAALHNLLITDDKDKALNWKI